MEAFFLPRRGGRRHAGWLHDGDRLWTNLEATDTGALASDSVSSVFSAAASILDADQRQQTYHFAATLADADVQGPGGDPFTAGPASGPSPSSPEATNDSFRPVHCSTRHTGCLMSVVLCESPAADA